MSSIQFKIGFYYKYKDCLHTSSSISIVVQMPLTFGLSTVMASTPLLCARHTTVTGTARPPVKGR
jgi:hypothetical protein